MRRLFRIAAIFFLLFCWQMPAYAALDLVLTQGVSSALPIAVLPFDGQTDPTATNNVASVISADLQNSGQFKVTSQQTIPVENVVTGQVKSLGGDQYQVTFSLSDAVKGQAQILVSNNFTVSGNQLRPLAHHISDIIYQQLTGVRGVFSTKIAYVLVQRNPGQQPKYILEVADEDGFNPKVLLTSTQPVMSPAWSHDGKRLAYVSFEKVTPQIFVQDVATGQRRVISGFPGINGAPAWSPDNSQLAIVLSKTGTPKIYVMNLVGGNLRQVTTGNAIDTEPTWTPDGKSLIFTSDRGGGPQIYRIDLNGGAAQRITFKGDYNARASIAADGKSIAMINREQGMYNIGLQDLQSGNMLVLTQSGYNSSPSLAPNGRMVLFEADNGVNGVLGMVSVDGRVRITLPAQEGSVQDPAWSPFLS